MLNDIHNSPKEAIYFLSNWVKDNTSKGQPSPRFGLDDYLIVCRDGLREGLEDLILFTYHETAGFRNPNTWKWVEKVSRGLVFEKGTGKQITNPFYKFFNYGDLKEHGDLKECFYPDWLEYKHDGSLGICFFYNDLWYVTTYGSLNSEQGIFATNWLRAQHHSNLCKSASHMVEIVYPENRIVSDYGDYAGLLYLESKTLLIDTNYKDSFAMQMFDVLNENLYVFENWYYDGLKDGKWQTNDWLSALLDFCTNQPDYSFEGFVYNDLKNNTKVKFKTEAYLKVHRVRFDISFKNIKALMIESPETLLNYKETLPNEFYREVDEIITVLNDYAVNKVDTAKAFLKEIYTTHDITDGMTTKEISNKVHHDVCKLEMSTQHIVWSIIKGREHIDLYNQALKFYEEL